MIKKTILISFLFTLLFGCNRKAQFDSEIWKSSGGELIMTDNRLNMTNDLLSGKILLGKTRIEIDSLLGHYNHLPLAEDKTYLYLVKEVYSSDIDPDELIYIAVKFDSLNRAYNAEIIRKK